MLLKLPGYLKQAGRQDELRMDGIVPVDAAPRGGFGAEGKGGKMKGGLDFPPVLYVTMQVRQGAVCVCWSAAAAALASAGIGCWRRRHAAALPTDRHAAPPRLPCRAAAPTRARPARSSFCATTACLQT